MLQCANPHRCPLISTKYCKRCTFKRGDVRHADRYLRAKAHPKDSTRLVGPARWPLLQPRPQPRFHQFATRHYAQIPTGALQFPQNSAKRYTLKRGACRLLDKQVKSSQLHCSVRIGRVRTKSESQNRHSEVIDPSKAIFCVCSSCCVIKSNGGTSRRYQPASSTHTSYAVRLYSTLA